MSETIITVDINNTAAGAGSQSLPAATPDAGSDSIIDL
jgi:hypothetical protein